MIEIKNHWTGKIVAEGETIQIAAESKRANLYGADLCGANLRGADLRGAHLCGANLRGANLRGADLRGANLHGANLRGADLRGADLYGADLCGADLCGADLRGADLYGADLYGADLCGADLCGANLRGADLCGAKYGEELLLKYFTVGPIGSRADYLQVFITDKQTAVKTGCFSGTLEELATRTDRADYKAAIQFIQAMVELERIKG